MSVLIGGTYISLGITGDTVLKSLAGGGSTVLGAAAGTEVGGLAGVFIGGVGDVAAETLLLALAAALEAPDAEAAGKVGGFGEAL